MSALKLIKPTKMDLYTVTKLCRNTFLVATIISIYKIIEMLVARILRAPY